MLQEQPQSPSGIVLNQVALSPPATAASDFKFRVPHISIEIPGSDSASRRKWRPALFLGFLLFLTATTQAVLASGIRRKGIHVSVTFHGGGSYYATAGNPVIGLLAVGVAGCFFVLSLLDRQHSRGDWVKSAKLLATVYSCVALVVMAAWSFVERAVFLQLSSFEHCADDIVNDGSIVGGTECVCLSSQSDDARVGITSGGDVSCHDLLDYADDVLASYVLMVVMLALTVAGIWCKPYTSKPTTTAIVLEASPTPYVVTRTSPTTHWGRYPPGHAH